LLKSLSAAGVANIVAGVFMFAFGFMFLRVYNNWATQTVKKKLDNPNYMANRDVKLMMPVTQKAKIEAKLEEKRTSSLLDAMAGFAVKIRRIEDELASIPRKKKKKGYDEIPPEEVDIAERLHRMQKYFTLDLNGAMAKSKAGLTKEALLMARYKREMGAAKAEREGSTGGSTVKSAVGSAAKADGEKAKSESAKGEKKAALEIESAGADTKKQASSFFSGVFGGAPVGDKADGGEGEDGGGEDRV
jgi:hypothetical protein